MNGQAGQLPTNHSTLHEPQTPVLGVRVGIHLLSLVFPSILHLIKTESVKVLVPPVTAGRAWALTGRESSVTVGLFFPSLYSCLPSISDQRVASVAINSSGDWIALGCSGWFPCPAVEGKHLPESWLKAKSWGKGPVEARLDLLGPQNAMLCLL